jgi:hypothetical protein
MPKKLDGIVRYNDAYPHFLEDIRDYVEKIETEDSGIVCSCLWRYNPLDIMNEVPPEKCRKLLHAVNELCPVHTKMGFIHGFFKFTVGEYDGE